MRPLIRLIGPKLMTGLGPVSASACAVAAGAEAGLAGSGLPPTMASADAGAPPDCGRGAVVVLVPPRLLRVFASALVAAAALPSASPFLVRFSRFSRPVGSTITRAKKSV